MVNPDAWPLAVMVVHQAVRDLDLAISCVEHQQAVHEARLWWLKDSGGWKTSRETWLELAGFDPDKATSAIRQKLAAEGVTLDEAVPPKHLQAKYFFTKKERVILQALPRGVPLTWDEMPRSMDHYYRHRLKDKGALVPLGEFHAVPHDLQVFATVQATTGHHQPPAVQ